nr:hypothetical protein [Tanacetum cinerariifolium]
PRRRQKSQRSYAPPEVRVNRRDGLGIALCSEGGCSGRSVAAAFPSARP